MTKSILTTIQHAINALTPENLSLSTMAIVEATADGPVQMNKIAASLNVSPAAITGMADRCEKLGLGVRSLDPSDRRKILFAATNKGRKWLAAVYAALQPAN